MKTSNSASNILKNVRPNANVLEFGASNGYMTQYLKETLHCFTFAVEINEENLSELDKYSDGFMIGETDGDIEKYHWVGCGAWDHILFADVLEHLRDPYTVLKKAATQLNDNGTILISIPNVSHNSIIVDLINNNFEYRELGLLDNTHIRFFTRKSLLKMVDDAGLFVSKEMNTRCRMQNTEFKNSLNDVPVGVADYLKMRQDGNIYQFVWELKLKESV